MRTLRVLGIADGGESVVCVEEDAERGAAHNGAQFTIPIDERLRAAVRGDLSRFGQLEIEMAPQLRPREIQSRIRAGASVEQVAAAAGCTPDRIERYAYPVLLERATVAEKARAVLPLQGAAMGSASAANARRTLEDIVTSTLTDRGQQQDAQWDAFRDERGWTVSLTWRAGRTENRAEWAFTARPDGGSVSPRNAEAADLVEPGPAVLRTISDTSHADDAVRTAGPFRDREPRLTHEEHVVMDTVTDDRSAARVSVQGHGQGQAPVVTAHGERDQATRTGTDGHGVAAGSANPAQPTGRSARRGHRPPMPSWEDVLLGTRAAER
ncbi:MAG: DUF3071 domain-containing protein [Actinobacteria bacterium]|nr:DUF3071 domain-containing protein [Actinomycetota bacterium]